MAGYVQYAKKLVLEDEVKKNQTELNRMLTDLFLFQDTVVKLRPFQGKQITKRITNALDKDDPNMVYHIEEHGSWSYLHLYKGTVNGVGRSDAARFYLADFSNYVYDEAFFVKQYSVQYAEESIEKLKACFAKLPDFVERYNNMLDTANALVDEANLVGLEYDFDILCRGSKK